MGNRAIIIKGFIENKVSAIRELRNLTGCSLKEAKEAVESDESIEFELAPNVATPDLNTAYLQWKWRIDSGVERALRQAASYALESGDYRILRKVTSLLEEIS